MWNLYALNRVNDLLLMPFQAKPTHRWEHPAVTPDQYVDFFKGIGLTPFNALENTPFSPFHHEVFEVEESDDADEPVTVTACAWPGLWFGELLFSRAGVWVRGGSRHIRKHVAENSTLYFAYRRLARPTSDLSHGWGHNSQRRTSIRRDYQSGSRLHYNVDGIRRLPLPEGAASPDGLTAEERLEVCRNRCFICTDKPHDDLAVFWDRWEEDAPETEGWTRL
jgi:hypothetical protein